MPGNFLEMQLPSPALDGLNPTRLMTQESCRNAALGDQAHPFEGQRQLRRESRGGGGGEHGWSWMAQSQSKSRGLHLDLEAPQREGRAESARASSSPVASLKGQL